MIDQILRIAERDKNILIVEFTKSHGELIYSMVHLLKRHGFYVSLFIHENNSAETFEADSVQLIPANYSNFRILRSLKSFIKKNEISKIIFNTVHGLQTRNAVLSLYFKKLEFFGIIHQAEKLLFSITQRIISSRVKKYFTLSDHILEYFNKNKIEGLTFTSFYPVYFPFDSIKNSPSEKFVVCIPGGIEFARKDYFGLIDLLEKERNSLPQNLIFQVLGDASTENGMMIRKSIDEKKLSHVFEFSNSFLSNKSFFEKLNNSDVILPLIQPGASEYRVFLETSISGAFNLAYYSAKPMLLNNIFNGIKEFENFSFYYDEKSFVRLLTDLIKNRDLLKEKENNIRTSPKFEVRKQAAKIAKFINSDKDNPNDPL